MTTPSANPNQALWEKGDFTRIAAAMRQSGEELVQRLGIRPGTRVLDLGCGDGTTAIPAAKAGADVIGIDIARNLVEAGNRRAAEEGLANCRFQQGDATNLQGIPDGSFDLVMSIFGAMFAPRPFDVAKEMARVGVHAASSRGIHQSHDLGGSRTTSSNASAPPAFPPTGFPSSVTRSRSVTRDHPSSSWTNSGPTTVRR